MSQSPLDASQEPGEDYLAAWESLAILFSEGKSFSGHERNCAFLNLGGDDGPRFANVSAASGLDFEDDGRGLALVDWDHDGDLDLWFSNRNAPRVRFLRNDATPVGNRYLAVRLRGTKCNRDAIGARLELHLQKPNRVLIRTLKTGDAFISQSSKWNHFGLGRETEVEQLVVRWPDGQRQVFPALTPDQHYILVQGESAPSVWTVPKRQLRLATTPIDLPPKPSATRLVLSQKPPLKALTWKTFDGQTVQFESHVASRSPAPQAVLLSLWATWCQPCLHELQSLSGAADKLREHGIEVITMNVDQLTPEGDSLGKAQQMLDRMKLPFSAGVGTPELIAQVELLFQRSSYNRRPFALPTSLLLDPQQRAVVIYRGPLEVPMLLEDARLTRAEPPELLTAAVPFPGRWGLHMYSTSPLAYAEAYLEGGYVEEAKKHLRNRLIEKYPEPLPLTANHGQRDLNQQVAKAHRVMGRLLSQEDQPKQALAHWRRAVQFNPGSALAQFDLGRALLNGGGARAAINPLQAAVELAPTEIQARFQLAVALHQSGEHAQAILQYGKVLEDNSNALDAANNLAWLLATCPADALRDPPRAVALAERTCAATGNQQPDALGTLAAAYAAAGRFQSAVTTARAAIRLAEAEHKTNLSRDIQERLQLYLSEKPYREQQSSR